MMPTRDYDVRLCYGMATMKPHQVARGERAKRAAERLAAYRLRAWSRAHGYQVVSEPKPTWDPDLFAGHRVAVCAKVTDAPVPPGFTVPDSWGARIRLPA